MPKKIIIVVLFISIIILVIGSSILVTKKNKKTTSNDLIFPEDINLKDIANEDGLLFRIKNNHLKCLTVSLLVYIDDYYEYYDTQIMDSKDAKTDDIVYKMPIKDLYDYDILKLIKSFKENSDGLYTINIEEREYIIDEDNKYLQEFLDSIDIDLNKCVKVENK